MAKIQITTEDIEKMAHRAITLLFESYSYDVQIDDYDEDEDDEEDIEDSGLFESRDKGNNKELYKFKKKHFKSKDKKISADSIIDWLKKDTTDCAAIAAQLWPNKAEDSRRSYFYKCRDHATYSAHGKTRHYDFTKKQYLRLFGIMTNSVS